MKSGFVEGVSISKKFRKMAGTHVKEEALVDSPTFVLEEEGLLRAFRFRKMAENGTHVKEEALVDSPTSVLEEEDSGEPTSGRNPEKQPKQAKGARKKRKRAAKCGACTGISRPCGPDCSYRMLFPTSSTKVEACLINKFFQKDQLLELAEKCKNAEEIKKCRDNLFRICGWLRSDPVNIPLVDHAALKVKEDEYMVLMQKIATKQVGIWQMAAKQVGETNKPESERRNDGFQSLQ